MVQAGDARRCRRQPLDVSIAVASSRRIPPTDETKPRAIKHRLAEGCAGATPRIPSLLVS